MTVAEVMTEDVVGVDMHTSFHDVVQTLAHHRINGAPVLDADRHCVGMVTEADLPARQARLGGPIPGTHEQRPALEVAGGTTFHFVQSSPKDTLTLARKAAGDLDVRIGGGVSVVRTYLAAGLGDRLHVGIAPILLGRGVRLWDDLHELEIGYKVDSEVASSGTIHLTFSR